MSTTSASYLQRLNVVFHGLWAYEIRDDGIYAHTSIQPDHVVKAGKWAPDFDLKQGMVYELRGIQDGSQPIHFDETTNAIFKGRALTDPAVLYCTVKLPGPSVISSLRPISFATTPYLGRNADLIKSKKIAIVQAFAYNTEGKSVQLTEIDGKATGRSLDFDLPQPITNLYFYAQPPGVVPSDHFEEAFQKLAGMFGLDLIPVASMPPGPVNPEVAGLSWLDLVGLNERGEHESLAPAGGISGSSCDPFVVDNRSQNAYQSH